MYIFWITSSDNCSSERLEIRFRLFILCSIAGESKSADFGSLADENTDVAYLGSGSLN
jgi:hypothetical protein